MTSRRTARRPGRAGLWAVVALAMAAVSCLSPMAGGSGTPIAAPATLAPVAGATTPAASSGGWYSLYFATPAQDEHLANPTGGIPAQIAASFDAAQKTIDLAIYEFDLLPIAEALINAQKRGVQVRVVTDSDSLDEAGNQAIAAAGIPLIPDKRSAIMHDKFAVVDGAIVWTGSMNFTLSDAYQNDNNFIEIHSADLAQNYTHEFDKMFVDKRFGPHSKTDATPKPVVSIEGAEVENYFAPKGNVAEHINDALASARKSIYFLAFSFTRKDFGQTLLNQGAAGLDVRGVFESEQLAAGGSEVWDMLSQGGMGADIRQDGNSKNMHDKVFIVDQAVVVTGSYNFSASAEDDNDENVLIIHDPAVAAAYYAQFERLWAEGKE